MSSLSTHDPRVVLVREKFFTLRPEPLERYLWQIGLPQSAERVFWFHWQEGHRSGDWSSQVPLTRVAAACCLDVSTVTRAYQLLKKEELLRREDPGRDPLNPFQQATAVTEVRIPRALVTELGRTPNRPKLRDSTEGRERASAVRRVAKPAAPETPHEPRTTRRGEYSRVWPKLSMSEQQRYFQASRDRRKTLEFDADNRLSADERGLILTLLEQTSEARPEPEPRQPTVSAPIHREFAGRRRLSTIDIARARRKVLDLVPTPAASDVLRQVLWSVEEGALRRFDVPLALNIALKKIRDGAWTRPNRMPPNWLRLVAGPEPCSAA